MRVCAAAMEMRSAAVSLQVYAQPTTPAQIHAGPQQTRRHNANEMPVTL
jgi:hypothetical protein